MAGYDSSRVPLGPRDMRQGPGPIVYDRYTSFRTRSPSPDSLSRRMLPYHAATRPMNHHRDIYAGPNVYRPNVYRPDYDHYEPPPETFAVRDRSASWSSSGKPSAWNDRRTSLGAGPSRDADMLASRMAMAPSRMFEPSDSWKHTHDEPRLIPRVGGDRYRPATNDGGAYLHGRADVYRPSYDNSRSVRRQSGSDRRSRNSGSRRSPSRSRSRSLSSTSRSAASLSRSPFRASSTKSRSPIRRKRSSPDSSKRRSRSSSAFSVASSRPSIPPPNVNPHTTVSPPIRSNSPLPKVDPDLGASEEQAQPPPPSVTPDLAPVSPLLSHATQSSSTLTETAKSPEPPKEEVSSSSDIPITATPTSCAAPSSTEPAIPIPTSPVAASPQKLEEAEAKPATQLDLTNVHDPGLTVDSPPRDAHLATDQTVDTAKDKPMEPDATPAKLPTTQEPDPSAMLVEPDTLPDSKSEVPTVDDAPVPTSTTDQPPDEPIDEPVENIVPPSPERPALDEIPKFADTMHERLRIVVMTRLAHDTQSREEIIAPILTTNLSIARHECRKGTTADVLMQEILSGDKEKTRLESLEACKPSLVQQFETRQTMLMEKVERLRNEYIDLHEKWLVHCATLDEQAKPSETEAVQPSGRTTRRTANLTDTVRSDLEMEQIIASLGNDDATDPNHLSQRNLAVIPDMISVTRGQVDYAFDDTNHLVTDPHEYYAPRTGIDDWTEEEKTILCDKFAAHPKQFGIIADYLPNKTQAQCVSYYYLHKKKFINFRKVVAQRGPGKRKRRSDKRKGNALLTDIQRHDEELEGDSMSPAPTSAPTTTSSGRPRRRAAAQQSAEPVASRRPQPRRSNAHQLEATPASTPTPEPESRVRRRRSNQVVAPPTPVEEPEEDLATDPEQRPAKKPKRGRKVVKSAAIIPDDIIMDDTASEPPSTRPQSATPFQLPTLSEEQQLVMINLIKDYMNPQMAANSKPPTPVIGYPGTGIMIPNPPTVGATRYADIPTSRSPAGRPPEPMYPGAGIMSPIMGHTSINPASQPNAHFSANGEHINAGSSRISFHANPWVPSNFSAGSSRGSTPQPIAPQPMASSNPYGSGMPVLHPGRHLDSTFPSHPSSYGPPIPGGIPMGMPMPMGPSPLGLPSYPPTQLSMTSAGPPTSLERAESRLYRASGTFVPMSMASPIPLDSGAGSRGRNPYPVVPTSFSSSYNLPR